MLRLARMRCALMYHQNGDLAYLLKSARKKSAAECPFECGEGGGAIAIWAMPKYQSLIFKGASLTRLVHDASMVSLFNKERFNLNFLKMSKVI